jgi:hypothetical protein
LRRRQNARKKAGMAGPKARSTAVLHLGQHQEAAYYHVEMHDELAGAKDLQEDSTQEFIPKKQRADHTGKNEIIVKLTLIRPDEYHQSDVVKHRPSRIDRAGKAGAHHPYSQADYDQRYEIGIIVEMHG